MPRETLSYVVNVTGRSVEEWQKTPPTTPRCGSCSACRAAICRPSPNWNERKPNTSRKPMQPKLPPDEISQNGADRRHPRNCSTAKRIGDVAPIECATGDKHEAKEHGHRGLHERHGRA